MEDTASKALLQTLVVPQPDEILKAIQEVAYGNAATKGLAPFLEVMNLIDDRGALTASGLAVEETCFTLGQREVALSMLEEAYVRLPVTQVISQILKGWGNLPLSGLHHMLVVHGFTRPEDIDKTRKLAEFLRSQNIIVFSRKTQQVRISDVKPESITESPSVRIITPDRPYSNILHLHKIIAECDGYIYWADPHLSKKALDVLAEELDANKISDIRLLSGPAQISNKTLANLERFVAEANMLGIQVEWRVQVDDRDWHDRFIIGNSTVWNIPPINSLLKNDYSEAWKSSMRPPFDQWWQKAIDLKTFLAVEKSRDQ